MENGRKYRFVCPGCAESFAVNAPMRDAIVDDGCVLCGAPVPMEAFTPS